MLRPFGRGKIVELLVRDGGADVEARMVDPYVTLMIRQGGHLLPGLKPYSYRTYKGASWCEFYRKPCPWASNDDALRLGRRSYWLLKGQTLEVVADLLQRADANASDDNGDTALILAGSFEVIELWPEAFIVPALHKACYEENVLMVVRKQLKRGADVNSPGLADVGLFTTPPRMGKSARSCPDRSRCSSPLAQISMPQTLQACPRSTKYQCRGLQSSLAEATCSWMQATRTVERTLLDRDNVVNGYMSPLHYAVVIDERQIVKSLLDASRGR